MDEHERRRRGWACTLAGLFALAVAGLAHAAQVALLLLGAR
jgi:hypothetical protein